MHVPEMGCLFDFRIIAGNFFSQDRSGGCPVPYLVTVMCFTGNTIDPVCPGKEPVITDLIPDVSEDHEPGSDPKCKPQKINKTIEPESPEYPDDGFDVVSYHVGVC